MSAWISGPVNPALTRKKPPEVELMPPQELGARLRQEADQQRARQRYGPPLWEQMHLRYLDWPSGADDSAWLGDFANRVPCGDCRKHWRQIVGQNPPDWANLFAWSVARHNQVRRMLVTPEMDVAAARLHWSGIASANALKPAKTCQLRARTGR